MSTPRPTATGSLDSTPFLNLLIYALDHQLSGTLVLEEPLSTQRHAIHFDAGTPCKVKIAAPVAYLGQVLVDLGNISDAVRASTYETAAFHGELHGRVLCREGHIDEMALRVALREQVSRKLTYLASRSRDTLYGYYDRVNLLEPWGGEGVRGRPLEAIWRVIASAADPVQVVNVIARLGDKQLLLHNDAPLQRFHFGRKEQTVLEILRAKPQPLAELQSRGLAEPADVERLVYGLAVTRQLDLGGDVLPLGVDEPPSSIRPAALPVSPAADFGAAPLPFRGAGQSPIPPDASVPRRTTPAPEAPELAALREELKARAERSESDTLYEVLGVPSDAPPAEIQAVFLGLAKKWHPDRLPGELETLRELSSRVFARMSEASQVLGDALKRREYDQKLRRAGREAEEAEQVQRVLRAASAFQRAEVFFKRNNLPAAETEARQALADDPDQADYIALVAWLDALKSESNLDAALKALDRAIQIQPNNVRAHWYRGQLYKRAGRMGRAVRDFRMVVEREPRHLDAQRELRLFQMRRGDRSTSIPPSGGDGSNRPSPAPGNAEKSSKSGEGGFISKLFKR